MKFKSLKFNLEGNDLVVYLYELFYFRIPLDEIKKIDEKFKIKDNNEVIIKSDKKFLFLIDKYISALKYKINNNKAVYIHQNSGIPLLGLQFIGIVDKGTDMIEVKPITGCTMNCVFCSVGEGLSSKKEVDFVVEEEYLVNELAKVLKYKEHNGISVWINPHGEPLLYSRIADLAGDIAKLKQVKYVHIITCGSLLNKKLIDEFAGIKRVKLNVSISAFDENEAKKLMGTKGYDVKKVLDAVKYASSKIETIVTPVYMQGINDEEIEKLIEFCRENHIKIRIQKFCWNKFGRNPIKEMSWDDFEKKMKFWENKFNIELIEKGKIGKTKELPKPFKKGDTLTAEIVAPGRFVKDKVAVAKDRCILVPDCRKDKGKVKVKITSAKHGMYMAE